MSDLNKSVLASLFVTKLKQASGITTKARRIEFNDKPIELYLQNNKMIFSGGIWTNVSGPVEDFSPAKIDLRNVTKENISLKEKNRMLEFKMELLVDMLTAKELDLLNTRKELEEMYEKYKQYKKTTSMKDRSSNF